MADNAKEICRNAKFTVHPSLIVRQSQIPFAYKYAECKRKTQPKPFKDIRFNYERQKNVTTGRWFPKPVILYTHTEEVNPSVRINTFVKQSNNIQEYVEPKQNYYSTDEAQIQYLETRPVCFLVCGKPGLGQEDVAKTLAGYWNCCNLDPLTVIQQEIDNRTRTGRFIEFNLRSGRAIGADIILSLIKRLINSDSCLHRGYVISGLPLVPNEMYDADEPLVSESAIFAADCILNDLIQTASNIMAAEEESQAIDSQRCSLGSLVSDSLFLGKNQKFDLYASLRNQMNDVLAFFQRPCVIIYLKCPMKEALLHRDKLRRDIDTKKSINLLKDISFERRLPEDVFHYRRLAKEVRDMPGNVRDELDHYEKYLHPIVDRFILKHDQQFVITIDARLPLATINDTIKLKLRTLPLQKVLMVEKFSDIISTPNEEEEDEQQGEDVDLDLNRKIFYDYTDKSLAEVFADFQSFCIVGPRFRWTLSHWGYNCPVALRYGRYVRGNPKHTARFMNHIYFLENRYAMCLFQRNPRPYLMPPHPKSPGMIYLFGVEHCGVRDVAQCLSYVYDLAVIDVQEVCDECKFLEVANRAEVYREQVINDMLDQEHRKLIAAYEHQKDVIETKRLHWIDRILRYYALYQFKENEMMREKVGDEIMRENPFVIVSRRSEAQSEQSDDTITLGQLEALLENENVPTDTVFITDALENTTKLVEFFPLELKDIPPPERPVTLTAYQMGIVDDLVKRFAMEKVNEVTLSDDTIIRTIVEKIKLVEQMVMAKTENRIKSGGWIIVNLRSSKIFIDLYAKGYYATELIYFYDNDLDNKFLAQKYASKKFAPYHLMRDFLQLNGFEVAAKRCPETVYTPEVIEQFSKEALDKILQSDRFVYVDKRRNVFPGFKSEPLKSTPEGEPEWETNYRYDLLNNIEKFESAWDEISIFMAENGIEPLQINFAKSIEDVMLNTIEMINARFRMEAKDFNDMERELEAREFHSAGSLSAEQSMDEEFSDDGPDMVKRRLGDTHEYCPIALLKYNVLWKGKQQYTATYDHKLYFFSGENAKYQFMANPLHYVPLKEPRKCLPPIRICIIGPIASGKTTIAKMLARRLGLIYVNYLDMLNKYCLPRFVRVGRKNKDVYPVPNTNMEDYSPSPQEQYLFDAFAAYCDEQAPLPHKYLSRILRRIWQKEPYSSCGIVLDGFPFCTSDFEYMVRNFIIPDVVIHLQIRCSVAIQRCLMTLMNQWNVVRTQKQIEKKQEDEEYLKEWRLNRTKIFDELYSKKVEERLAQLTKQSDDKFEPDEGFVPMMNNEVRLPKEEALKVIERLEEADKALITKKMNEDFPEPQFEDDLESYEEAEQRLLQFIEDSYALETTVIQPFESLCNTHSIPFHEVHATKSAEKVLVQILLKLDAIKMRDDSFLETTYPITPQEAERLLTVGYYLLSNYGYSCPVQVFDGKHTIQQFLPKMAKKKIFPVIHRQYIYYLSSEKNMKIFMERPLKYTEVAKHYPLIAFRVAILGAPKCGKSSLANRYASEYGFKIVTRGEAIRYVLRVLGHTLLACEIEKQLRHGETIAYDLVIRAVEVYCSEGMAISQGIVFDGFPTCPEEMVGLFNAGLVPHTVIHLDSTYEFSNICLTNDNRAYDKIPQYSPEFMKHRYCMWYEIEANIVMWIDVNFQNINSLPCKFTRWSLWTQAKGLTMKTFSFITNYVQNYKGDCGWSLQYLSVSPHEMKSRLSKFRNYCICCWTRSGILDKSPMPIKRQNLIQVHAEYFYVCPRHVNFFLAAPSPHCGLHLPTKNLLPKDLPMEVTKESNIDLAKVEIAENGYCIICYVQLNSYHRLIKGSNDYVVSYLDKFYKFCSLKCQDQFMRVPTQFINFRIHIKTDDTLPKIPVKSLPTMGYLQQTQSRYLVKACTKVGMFRPKFPKLSAELSGLIYFGLYLKVCNPKTKSKEARAFKKYMDHFEEMCKNLLLLISQAKTVRNPYLNLEIEPQETMSLPKIMTYEDLDTTSDFFFDLTGGDDVEEEEEGEADLRKLPELKEHENSLLPMLIRRVPVPDERFDYLCNFYKPASKVPAFLTVVDIAGLVKGASEGQGLGNAFLSEISACDAIFHLCRAFENEDVIHVEGDVNPIRDLEIIADELRFKDIEKLNKELEKLEKTYIRGNDKKLKPEYDTLVKVKTILVDEQAQIRFSDWNAVEIEVLNKHLFLTSKPGIYLVNLSEKDYIKKKNKWLIKIKEWVDKNDPGAIIIPFSGALEFTLADMPDDERKAYLEENKTTSALDKIIVTGYKALQLEYFFTCGADEVKAWTIQKGTKAPGAAGRIHTHFEKGFIMAEVMKYSDFKQEGSETAVKAAGKYRQQGRNYVVEDGDIIYFKANTGAGLTKEVKKK